MMIVTRNEHGGTNIELKETEIMTVDRMNEISKMAMQDLSALQLHEKVLYLKI